MQKIKKTANKKRPVQVKEVVSGLDGLTYTKFDNIFASMSDEVRSEIIDSLGEKARVDLIDQVKQLQAIIRQYHPLQFLSHIATYALTSGVNDDGVTSTDFSSSLGQAQAELLQAISLATLPSDSGYSLINATTIKEVHDLLVDISHNFSLSRYNSAYIEFSSQEKAISFIQEKLRLHTQNVRNWGYHSQVVTISQEMYAPFDSLTDKKLGFSCSFASSFFQLIIKNIQQDLTARGKLLSELDKTKNSSELINRYQELAEIPKEFRRELADVPEMKGISHRNAFLFFRQHYDLRLPEFYCLSLENLAEQLNCTLDKVKNIVNYFSIASESLHGEKIEHFFLSNPVWAKPILEMEGSYYCFIPQLFFSFIFPISDAMVEKVDKHKLHKRRSDYLESKIKEIVARRFPSSKVHSSIEWNHECEQYETDLVAVIDSILVIIEAKSHNISSAALRGAPKSVKKHLEEIFVHPSQQSLRFETAIREEKEAISRGKAASMNLPFDLNAVHEIFRISVSLEDFATLQSDLRQFEATGWLPEGFVSCPTMNLADFEIVFDLLEHPVDILHYIKRRIEIEKKYHILGDELDYLGLYLSSFLCLDGFDSDPNLFMNISGMSSSIDRYYLSRDEGVLIEKPRPEINKFFVDVLTRLESRAAPRWSEIGLILKSFHPKDMRTIQKKIGELKKIINRNRSRKGIDDCNDLNSLIYNPPAGYNTALAIVLLKSEYFDRRHESYASAADSAMEDLTVKQCLVIGINIDLDDAPYHYIGLFCKDDLSK